MPKITMRKGGGGKMGMEKVVSKPDVTGKSGYEKRHPSGMKENKGKDMYKKTGNTHMGY